MTIVSNTGPLIALAKANRLDLLARLFGKVEIPPAVHRELFAEKMPEAERLDDVISRFIQVAALPPIPPEVQALTTQLGSGEQQAIALAYDRKTPLIMDDRAGRAVARRLNIVVTGLVGVTIRAKESGLLAAVRPLLEEIRQRGHWLSDELVAEAAQQTGE